MFLFFYYIKKYEISPFLAPVLRGASVLYNNPTILPKSPKSDRTTHPFRYLFIIIGIFLNYEHEILEFCIKIAVGPRSSLAIQGSRFWTFWMTHYLCQMKF